MTIHFAPTLIAAALLVGACQTSASPPPEEVSSASNPVQHEMLLLTTALANAVTGIGQGDVRSIRHDLHKVHAAKDATGEALRGGTYRPPSNPDQIALFEALDTAFHAHLERLVAASRKNDVPAAAEALALAVQGCHGCHLQFRDPASPTPVEETHAH